MAEFDDETLQLIKAATKELGGTENEIVREAIEKLLIARGFDPAEVLEQHWSA